MTAGSKQGELRGGRRPLRALAIYGLLRRAPDGLLAREIQQRLGLAPHLVNPVLCRSGWFHRNETGRWTVQGGR